MSRDPSIHLPHGLVHPAPRQDRVALATTGRAGRNLPAAIGTSVILIALVVGSLAVNESAFVILVGVLALVGLWELGGAFVRVGIRMALAPLYVGGVGMLTCAWTLGPEALVVSLFLTVLAVMAWRLLDGRSPARVSDVTASVFAAVYVPFLASFVILILRDFHQPWLIAVYAGITALNDLGGWGAGVLFGKHPMAPRLSPKKSWEGFAGSVLACTGGAVLAFWLLGAHWWWGILVGVVIAAVGTLGDLTESLLKREVGLKDMSNLLPGHGGLLDRVDAMLVTAPVFHFFFVQALGVPA
ncbi:phosphatidate cytidylyltransferase [Schaalia sp. 19OD2882]|uniref:phosphatidate cytidylyltransferase n=1 Tax=Schaalia sp. 19OD2882 TaxID=2794089 RepID=UPI001C1EA847|nr:phosphatidate cytidylyltransferase [Schaalia sp. 19OD2882]QWW18810.1 phosphatidate cytidylyltransferase [Schaalia sp. 19OD2882]